MGKLKLLLLAAVALLGMELASGQQLKLAGVFGDNMVLQQKAGVKIWGWTVPGRTVTIHTEWDTTSVSYQADPRGYWEAWLTTPAGSYDEYGIEITDGHEQLQIQRVLIGEVWLGSGQSNMEMKLAPDPQWNLRVEDAARIMSEDTCRYIRTFNVIRNFSFEPLTDLNTSSGWIPADKDNIGNFSATGFFFARQIREHLDVPVGFICCAFGGTPLQSWLPGKATRDTLYTAFNQTREIQMELNSAGRDAAVGRMRDWLDTAQSDLDENLLRGCFRADSDDVELPGLLSQSTAERYGGSLLAREVYLEDTRDVILNVPSIDRNARVYWNGILVYENLLPSEAFGSAVVSIPEDIVREGSNTVVINLITYLWNGGITGEADNFFVAYGGEKSSLVGRWKYVPAFELENVAPMPLEGQPDEFIISSLYNAMLSPVIGYRVAGMIWQQGEANVDQADDYPRMLADLVRFWRIEAGNPFPFYYAELPPWRYSGGDNHEAAYMRLKMAEARTLVPECDMAVTIDAGEYENIHSSKKKPVGERLAALALRESYGIDTDRYVPEIVSLEHKVNCIELKLSNSYGGLYSEGAPLFELSLNGTDYVQAGFHIENDCVTVYDRSGNARFMRYNFINFPHGHVFNSKGLPLDNFIMGW